MRCNGGSMHAEKEGCMRQPVELRFAPAIVLLAISFARNSIAASAAAPAYAPPPLATYGQLPSLEDPALSPAGDRLAYIDRRGDQRYVVVIDLTKWQPLATARIGETKVRGLAWY